MLLHADKWRTPLERGPTLASSTPCDGPGRRRYVEQRKSQRRGTVGVCEARLYCLEESPAQSQQLLNLLRRGGESRLRHSAKCRPADKEAECVKPAHSNHL